MGIDAGAVGIFAAAHHLQSVGAGEILHSGLKVDVQILVGIVVGHMHRHIEVDTAYRIHQLYKALGVHFYVEVNGEAHDISDLLLQGIDAVVGIHITQFIEVLSLVGDTLYQGVPGDRDHGDGLVYRVIGSHDHGVHVAAGLVAGAQQEGIGILLPLTGGLGALLRGGRLERDVFALLRRRGLLLDLGRLGQQLEDDDGRQYQHGCHCQNDKQDPGYLLSGGQRNLLFLYQPLGHGHHAFLW